MPTTCIKILLTDTRLAQITSNGLLQQQSLPEIRAGHVNQRFVVWDHYPVDRDFVSLPEALIESKDSDLLEDLRPLFDGVWNACGWVRCFDYNEQGKWAPPA